MKEDESKMANLISTITIKTSEYRPCIVNNQKALFHRWEDKQEQLSSGNIVTRTLAIIEREDGSMHEAYPHEVVFCDRKIDEYCFSEGE
jgi:hypothetical protein